MGCGGSKPAEPSPPAPKSVPPAAPAAAPAAAPVAKIPRLTYFSIAGRGEVARLIAAAGEVEFEDKAWAPAFDETGSWRQGYKPIGEGFGFPGVLPILEHNELKLFQTTAIESYLAGISPKFSGLTPAQKAKDAMFLLIKSDINASTESLLFKKITAEDLTPIMEKWYPIIEGLLPEKGFINGLGFPTPGDVAVMVVALGCMPFRAAPEIAFCGPNPDPIAGIPGKYPKMMDLAAATAASPTIAAFLRASEHKTLKADPFRIMPTLYEISCEWDMAVPEAYAAATPPAAPEGKPVLNYFAIAGRGELSRLICAAGEVEFEDKLWDPAFDETGGWRQGYKPIGEGFGFPGVLPILEHGEMKLFQTTAIESYLAALSPVYAGLTEAEKAKDMMFQLIKSDINGSTESLLFKKITAEDLTPIMDKWYGIIEGLLPAVGFINGKAFPTPADLSILLILKGCMPFQAAPTMAGCAPTADKYPKMFALAEATAAYGKVAAFLSTAPTSYKSSTLKADPFGIMPAEYAAWGPAPPAPTKKGYVYGFFDMKDPMEFKTVYSPMAEPTLEPYGGKFVMKHALAPPLAAKMGMKETKCFGTTGQMAFMLEFPSFEKAMGWFTGPEYAAVLSKRDEVADFKMAVVEGAPITPGAGLVLGFFDMKDPKEFKTVYSPMAEPTLEPYGGKFAIKFPIAPPLSAKMGTPETKSFGETGQMAFALEFADFDKAMGWFTGPEYAAVLTKRDEVADFKMAVVQTMG